MASTAPGGSQSRRPERRVPWGTLAWLIIVIAALAAMIVAPFYTSRETRERRRVSSEVMTPFRDATARYHTDVLRIATIARAYAATRDPAQRENYDTTIESLRLHDEALDLAARIAGFADEAAPVLRLGREYNNITDAIIAAEEAGDDFESFRLIQQEGEPRLVELDAAATGLELTIDGERADLREEIDGLERRERIAIGAAAFTGLLGIAAVSWLFLANQRLARRATEARARLDDIVEGVPGVVWEAWGRPDAKNQRIDYVSPYVESMLGYSTAEWLSTPNFWLSIVHPDDRELAARQSTQIFQSGVRGSNRFRWIARDGRILWVEATSAVITDDQGAPAGMRGVTIDITPQVRADEALRRERALLASILASIDYGVYQTDEHGSLVYMNPAAEELLGYRTDEILGHHTHHLFHHSTLDGHPVPLDDCQLFRASGANTVYRGIEAFTSRAARTFPVEVAAASVLVDGNPVGAVIVFQDISGRLRREQLRDDFVAFASHELRNPLTTIKGFSRWLQGRVSASRTLDDDGAQAVDTLVEEAAKMESIIDLFLDLARIESDRLALEIEPVDLRRLLREECDRLRSRHPGCECELELPGESVLALADDHRLRQVLVNLLDNAAKYGGDPPRIIVTLEAGDAWATMHVRDFGPGIPFDDQAHVFDRYYRGRENLRSPGKGIGVGLFVSREIVQKLGGTLTFNSSSAGTDFELRVPVASAEDEDTGETPLPGEPDTVR